MNIPYEQMSMAEKVNANLRIKYAFEVATVMNQNDPNGDYSAEWVLRCPNYCMDVLLQWVEDCGGVDYPDDVALWLQTAIIKVGFILK